MTNGIRSTHDRPAFGSTSGSGLHAMFFLMIIALCAGGAVMLLALDSYPRDVATARASGSEAT